MSETPYVALGLQAAEQGDAHPPGVRLARPQVAAVAVLALLGALQSTCTYAVQPELPVYLARRAAGPG